MSKCKKALQNIYCSSLNVSKFGFISCLVLYFPASRVPGLTSLLFTSCFFSFPFVIFRRVPDFFMLCLWGLNLFEKGTPLSRPVRGQEPKNIEQFKD